jgi:hypothetical protein
MVCTPIVALPTLMAIETTLGLPEGVFVAAK